MKSVEDLQNNLRFGKVIKVEGEKPPGDDSLQAVFLVIAQLQIDYHQYQH